MLTIQQIIFVTTNNNNMMSKFKDAQTGRTLIHPKLFQVSSRNGEEESSKTTTTTTTTNSSSRDGDEESPPSGAFSFVVCADTQIGMSSENKEWETELQYSRIAIKMINEMDPLPLFCCVCGDLTDMEYTFNTKEDSPFTKEQCDEIQIKQRQDFQSTWSELHDDIALVCICGNHDIGNRPTKGSIDKFKDFFGDDYFAFWSTRQSYNIVLNTTLFSNPTGAEDLYNLQLAWLEDRLSYAQSMNPTTIFVFGHHPWFLYNENEDTDTMTGISPYKHWTFPDSYFHIPKKNRMKVMELFEKYNVTAAFSGHFHQNMVSESTFGMKMIVTGPLSDVMESSGRPKDFVEPSTRGIRIVNVAEDGSLQHKFISLLE